MTYGYAIARTKKLKRHNLAGSEAHTARTRETPNADPEKQNIRLIGSTEQNERLEDLVLAKIGQYEQKRKIRTDAVYCVEILLTASPQYYRPDDPTRAGYYHEDKLKQWVDANLKWLQDAYQDRIVRCELHLDEATPHLHAYLVPLDKDGQLRCNHFFDGRQKMMAFQDDYHTAMELLGLERGIKGSKAQHQDIKDFYRIVEEGKDLEPGKLTSEQLQAKAADRDRAIRKKKEMEATAKQLVKENEALEARIQQLSAENQQLRSELKQLADQLRDLPLEDVAWHLGLTQDTKGNLRWKGVGHIINIDGSKWYDFSPSVNKGGGGAIDLVMHVNGCNFKEAIAWLSDRFGEDGAQRAAAAHARKEARAIANEEPKPQPHIPTPDESKWHSCRQYLTQTRGIPAQIVDSLHLSVRIYADSRGNTVFLMRDGEENPTGAYLRGEGDFKGYTKGTRRSEGHFYFGMGDGDKIQQAVLCKSPIDALSAAALAQSKLKTVYIAVDSVSTLPKLKDFLADIPVLVAHGGDESGKELATAIQKELPHAQAKTAPLDMDWNDLLLHHLAQNRLRREESFRQQPDLEL
jgi:hypothetical protein